MRIFELFEAIGKFGGFFGSIGGSNGTKADVQTLKADHQRLREQFDKQAAERSGYIAQLENHGRNLESMAKAIHEVELMTQRNAGRIDELGKLIGERSDKLEKVSQRLHDLREELSTDILVLQVVCEKVGVTYHTRR